MPRQQLEKGDRIRIGKIPNAVVADGERFPETLRIFQAALGKTYEIRDIGVHGHHEIWLRPDGSEDFTGGADSIWIEEECVSPCERCE